MTEPIVIENELLRTRRELDRHHDGVVVTLRIESRSRMPVKFQLFDPLPGRLAADTVGFHPDDEPTKGRIDTELAVVAGVVDPGEPHVTRYAIHGEGLPSDGELHRLQEGARPSVEISDLVDPTDEDRTVEAALEQAAMTRSASQPATRGSEPTPFESSDLGQQWSATEPELEAADSEAPETSKVAADTGANPPSREEEEYPTLAELFEDANGNEPNHGSPPNDEADETAALDGEVDVAERLLDQLEAGDVSQDQRQQIADHLADAVGVKPPRQLASRIEALESELSAFDAYVTTLDGIIDEYGSPEAFLGEIREDISALAESMAVIEQEVDAASAARSRTEETLDEVDDTLARLASRTERLDDRLRSLREDHRDRAAEINSRIDEFEAVTDRVETLHDEVASLSEAVEEVEARRRAVWRALHDEDETLEE